MHQETALRGGHVMRGIVCALAGSVCWGFSGTCAQLVMGDFGAPAYWITCVRMLISAVFFLAIVFVKDWRSVGALFRDWRSMISIAAFSIFGIALCQVSYFSVIHHTSAGVGTTIEQLGLVLIMLWTCLRKRRLPNVREVLGLVFAMVGLVLIATQGDLSRLALSQQGCFWGMVSAVAFALYTLMPVKVLAKWGSLMVTGFAMLFGGLVLTPVVQPWVVPVDITPAFLIILAAVIVVGTCAAYMLFLQGINDCGPVKAGLLCAAEPVSAMVISVLWLHTPVSTWDIAGCACILVMIVMVTEFEPKREGGESALELAGVETAPLPQDPPVFAGRASVLGYYSSRPATMVDIARVEALLDDAHRQYAEMGIDEGKFKKYPSSRRLTRSIDNGSTYVVENAEGKLIAVFGVSFDPDKNYERGIKGDWITDTGASPQQYAELHWVVVDRPVRRRGVGSFIVDTACRIAREGGRTSLRADIYPENEPMRWLLEKRGFAFCGTIQVRDGFGREKPRSAYELRVR